MSGLLAALSAERLKLRGTLAAWMCLIAPAVVVLLYVLQMNFVKLPGDWVNTPDVVWQRYASAVLMLWAFLMLPLFVTLQSALLANLEHAEQQWKHLLALPVPRRSHYLAKLLALVAMLAAATLCLLLLIPVGGWMLAMTRPELGISGAPPLQLLLTRGATIFTASLLVLSLHTWIAIRWRSFTVAVACGMTATVMGYLIGQSQRFGPWYPWSMPLQAMASRQDDILNVLLASLLGALLVAGLGLYDFVRRDMA